MSSNSNSNSESYIENYTFSKQGGGGGISLSHLLNPAILTTSLMLGGENANANKIQPPRLGTELFVPGGLIHLPDNAFQETREYIPTDPFHVPVMDLFDDLLELIEVDVSKNMESKSKSKSKSHKTMTKIKIKIKTKMKTKKIRV